jgi:hypothetical protein
MKLNKLNSNTMENVRIDHVNKAALASFKGFLEFEEHRKLGEQVLNLAINNGYSKLVIDTTELKVIRQETQKWIETEWFPKASRNGIKYMAFVISSDTLGKMSTKKVNEKAGNIEIQHVDSLTKAVDWINSKN